MGRTVGLVSVNVSQHRAPAHELGPLISREGFLSSENTSHSEVTQFSQVGSEDWLLRVSMNRKRWAANNDHLFMHVIGPEPSGMKNSF